MAPPASFFLGGGWHLDFSKLMHFREHFLVTFVMWISSLEGRDELER